MDPAPAVELASGLLASLVSDAGEHLALARHVATISQGHPFLIQHVADRLRVGGQIGLPEAERTLEELIDSAGDPLELGHYLHRLDLYLDDEQQAVALAVLDRLAVSEGGLTLAQLMEVTGAEREGLIRLLASLRKDLYVERADGSFTFRLGFLKAWWRLERAL
jgi:hypothetical protein